MLVKSGETIATVPRDSVRVGFTRAELRLEGLKPPVDSFEARFFAGEPNANAQTPTYGNPHYLGTQFFYGLGVPDENPVPQRLYSIDRASQSERTEVRLNVTPGLRNYLQSCADPAFPVTVVAVDRDGTEIPNPDLDVEGISIEAV
jgi:hypothetical protein